MELLDVLRSPLTDEWNNWWVERVVTEEETVPLDVDHVARSHSDDPLVFFAPLFQLNITGLDLGSSPFLPPWVHICSPDAPINIPW